MIAPRGVASMLAALLAMSLPVTGRAQPPVDALGDWHGMLETPRGNLTLILTVSKDENGALKAQLESPDQAPGRKIPANSVSVIDGQLAFAITPLNASYKGSWVEAAGQWQGIFTQGVDLPLALSRGLPAAKPVITGMDGLWSGLIERNGARLRILLRIRTTDQGTQISLDSPDQMATGLAVQDFQRAGDKISFKLDMAQARYDGTLASDGTQMDGTWTQGDQPAMPISFARTQEAAERQPPSRPQMPTPPFPYTVTQVTFDNPVQRDVHLAATLTLPAGQGPFPAAILISGSGMHDRDETLMGHKPFAVIADHLTRHGIAVLRYDDRGAGQSTGNYAAATSADLATDANAAARFLMTRDDIRPDAIGFIGHSEGGMIGPIAMRDNDAIAYLVMLAGPGTHLDQLLLSQRRLLGATMGISEEEADRAEPVMAAIFKAIADGVTQEAGLEAARAALTPQAMVALGLPADTDKGVVIQQVATPWFRYFLQYNPATNLARIDVPVLALNGSLDLQVPAGENLPAIRTALRNNHDATTMELPGLNHLFQTAGTGSVGEYADLEETFAPAALAIMTDWINARFAAK